MRINLSRLVEERERLRWRHKRFAGESMQPNIQARRQLGREAALHMGTLGSQAEGQTGRLAGDPRSTQTSLAKSAVLTTDI